MAEQLRVAESDCSSCSSVETALDSNQRRRFLKVMGGSVAALVTLPAASVLAQAKGVKLSLGTDALKPLRKVGGAVVADIPSHKLKLLLIRDSETSVRAVQPMCTHKKSRLAYNVKVCKIECTETGPNHNSVFNLDGVALSGAALKKQKSEGKGNLQTYKTKLVKEGDAESLLIKLG